MSILALLVSAAAALLSNGQTELQLGIRALESLQINEALVHLKKAQQVGSYNHADHARLYEQLGIAYAYAGDKKAALVAFKMLLAVDPGHVIPYTLSPKVTFLFQKARRQAERQPAPTIQLSWPPDLEVADTIPIAIEVLADPEHFLNQAVLYSRRQGAAAFAATRLALGQAGLASHIELAAIAPEANAPTALELYLVALDSRGNEVLQLGSPRFPRRISLAYNEPLPWYKRWWVWAIVGGTLAVASASAIYFTTREPPSTVGGELVID
jgi:tetratricopeptide (TPR) repeat protein